jgi:serine/threonine-protein kinase
MNGTQTSRINHELFSMGGAGFALSPDGRLVALTRLAGRSQNIWLLDAARGIMTQQTSGELEGNPIWTTDGRALAFTRRGDGGDRIILRRLADGAEQTLAEAVEPMTATDFNVDSSVLLFTKGRSGGPTALLALQPPAPDAVPRQILASQSEIRQAQLSPDGKWLAYSSDESGGFEVYVVRYPQGTDKSRISTAGGQMPRWSSNSQTLYHLTLAGVLMATPISGNGPGESRRLFQLDVRTRNSGYRFALHGDRVLLGDVPARPITLQAMLNWTRKLRP